MDNIDFCARCDCVVNEQTTLAVTRFPECVCARPVGSGRVTNPSCLMPSLSAPSDEGNRSSEVRDQPVTALAGPCASLQLQCEPMRKTAALAVTAVLSDLGRRVIGIYLAHSTQPIAFGAAASFAALLL